MDIDAKVAERKQRWMDFYDVRSPRRFMCTVQYSPPDAPARPWPYPENKVGRLEWAWQSYLHGLERVAWLDDDYIPFLDTYTGTEIFAAAFGCQVAFPQKDMPFALPCVQTPREAERLRIPDVGATLGLQFEIADELRRRAGPGALMRMVDLQGPMDVVALIWDKNTLFPALLEAPDAVLELAEKVCAFQTAFLDEWFERYGREFLAHYPEYYMAQGVTLSEDEVGSVSQAMFDRFFLPELTFLSNRYGGMGMHCCANSRHQWRGFLRIPGLRLLNLNQPAAVLAEGEKFFAGHVAQMHDYPAAPDLARGPEQFPASAHLALRPSAAAQPEAQRLVEIFHQKYS